VTPALLAGVALFAAFFMPLVSGFGGLLTLSSWSYLRLVRDFHDELNAGDWVVLVFLALVAVLAIAVVLTEARRRNRWLLIATAADVVGLVVYAAITAGSLHDFRHVDIAGYIALCAAVVMLVTAFGAFENPTPQVTRVVYGVCALLLVAGIAVPAGTSSFKSDVNSLVGGFNSAVDSTDSSTDTTVRSGPKLKLVEVVGEPVVASQDYGLPDTTGYSTAVVFKVRNPNHADVTGERFRVTLASGSGAVLVASDGDDTFSIRADEERWVVFDDLDTEGTRPEKATVTTYAPTSSPFGSADHGRQADPSGWAATNRVLNCDNGLVECDATADLTYAGVKTQTSITAYLVIHEGNESGPVIGGGTASPDDSSVEPKHPTPLSFNVVLMEGKENATARGEFYVESFDAAA
jgi:hypothetical protein